MVDNHAARPAGEDRRQDRAPRPVDHFPDGGGDGPTGPVRRDTDADCPVAGAARARMTGKLPRITGASGRTAPFRRFSGANSPADLDNRRYRLAFQAFGRTKPLTQASLRQNLQLKPRPYGKCRFSKILEATTQPRPYCRTSGPTGEAFSIPL